MGRPGRASDVDGGIEAQIDYYRALAPDYDGGGLEGEDVERAGLELERALEAFAPSGNVLELACGTGRWTERLAAKADRLTAIDSSPEMLAIARQRVAGAGVRFLCEDMFRWTPDDRYDRVVFAHWISHVPEERFEDFWALVGGCLAPGGRAFFCDDSHRTAEEASADETGETVRRRLADGSEHTIYKLPHEPEELRRRLLGLGWEARVEQTAGPFYWGVCAPR